MNPKAEYQKNITTINMIQEIITCLRQQNYNRAERLLPVWSRTISATIEVLFASKDYFNQYGALVDELGIMETMKGILQTQEQGDYILLADLMELQLLPFLYSLQDVIRRAESGAVSDDYFEQNVEILLHMIPAVSDVEGLICELRKTPSDREHYLIEDTNQGSPTLKYTSGDQSYYLHSNNDPEAEGLLLAKEYYHEDIEHYTVYGLGLAYHIAALQRLCDGTCIIDVYESDIRVIRAAFSARNLAALLRGGVRIHYDPDLTKLGKEMQKSTDGLMLHAPSIRAIQNENLRTAMNELFVQESSIRNQGADMLRNFKSNTRNCKLYVDILKDAFKGKTVYLIAAGPSLDKNIALLKKRPEQSIILCVGTSYRKLMLQQGIVPDYVIFLDAAPRMYVQASDFVNENIPYLIASTACRRFAEDYHGPKYLICQAGYPKAEEYAKERGYNIYQSGGSVSTIALDVAIQLGAARVVCLGLDLAYTGNKMHATHAGKYDMIESDDLVQVKDWDGKLVNTSAAMAMYRKWIERRVEMAHKERPELELINATEGGAYIQGMRHVKLSDI